MSAETGKDHLIRNRVLDVARESIAIADGLLLSQPRNILWSFDTEDIGMREAIRRGILNSSPLVLFPPMVGVLTYAVTKSAELAVAATGVAYVVEGVALDFCEVIAYAQSSSAHGAGLYGRWTYPLQRKLAELSNYPKMTAPYWL